jgi:hypothetical protein
VGDITYTQTLKITAGKTPTSGSITEKHFEINPAEILDLTDLNEDLTHRFAIPDGTIDDPLCVGTISEIKVLVIKPETDLEAKLVNTAGTSQNITFIANRSSVIHAYLTNILVSNSSGSPIKGVFFVAGD